LKKNNSLIAVQGPAQLIAALIAYKWCECNIFYEKSNVTLIVYDTGVPLENEVLFQNSINTIAGVNTFKHIIFISQQEMSKISKVFYSDGINMFKKLMNEQDYEYVYIARGFGSFGTKLILDAYSKSLKIEYGDSFGLVGNEKYIELSYLDFIKTPINYLKSKLKKVIYQHHHKNYIFDYTVLSIPLVWDLNYLKDKSLIIPEKLFVKNTFSEISSQLLGLHKYCEDLIANSEKKCNIYLLSNLYNSGFCSLEGEVDLYEEIILQNTSPGEIIILKNHPRGIDDVLIQLKDRLKDLYEVKVVSNKLYSFIPIELWTVLLRNSKVFPIFSSSAISLKYLFSKQVSLTFDYKKIKKYIFFNKIEEAIQSEIMCEKAINTLDFWDEKTPLWIKD
jgi:hypothetical protein